MRLPWRRRRETIKTAVAPPPAESGANGSGATPPRMTTGEWEALVDAEDAGADAAMERGREACERAVSAVRERRVSGGHATVKP